jgi:periplasmic protein TonB
MTVSEVEATRAGRRGRPLRGLAVAGSLCLHVGMALLIFVRIGPAVVVAPQSPAAPIMLTLERPSAPVAPAPDEQSPSEDRTAQSETFRRQRPPLPTRVPRPVAAPFAVEVAPEAPKVRKAEVAEDSRASSAPPPRPSAAETAPPSGQVRSTWEGRVVARLESVRQYPRSARNRRGEGVTYVRFVMDRSGRVLSSRVSQTSGQAILDRAALDTVMRAQPLPPPPDEVRGDRLELVVPVEFFISAQ